MVTIHAALTSAALFSLLLLVTHLAQAQTENVLYISDRQKLAFSALPTNV
jgi:hypothetical protein